MTTKRFSAMLSMIILFTFMYSVSVIGEVSPPVNPCNPQGYHGVFSDSGKWIIVDQNGESYPDLEFEYLDDRYYSAGIIPFSDDGLYWGFLDSMTGYISEQDYCNIYINEDPTHDIIALDIGGGDGLGFFSRKEQRMIIEHQYNGENYTEFVSGWAWVQKFYDYEMDDFDVFLINESNEKLELDDDIIPLSNFSQGRCKVSSKTTWLVGFIDTQGHIVIDLQYESAWDFDKNGLARVWDQDHNSWMIDVDGNPVPL